MTIERDNLIDFKFKQQLYGLNSMSKLVTSFNKSSSLSVSSASSASSSPSSSPSPSSSSYSLTSGVGSNINSTINRTDQIILEESFFSGKRPTLLSEYILTKEQLSQHDSAGSTSVSSAKLSSNSFNSDERYRESTIVDHFPELSLEQQTSLIDKWVPFNDIQQKILVPDADPKKFVFNYNSSNLSAKKELNYLGIVDVNPDEYTQKYGAELKSAADLPKYILDIKTPDNLRLAADLSETEMQMHELEGDLEALKLVDLESEDLGIYRQYLQKMGITFS